MSPDPEPEFTKDNSITITGFVWDPPLHPENAESISGWKSGGARVKISELERLGFSKANSKVQKNTKALIRKLTIRDCILGILGSISIDQDTLDKVLGDIANNYPDWFLEWIEESIQMTGPITKPSIEWR